MQPIIISIALFEVFKVSDFDLPFYLNLFTSRWLINLGLCYGNELLNDNYKRINYKLFGGIRVKLTILERKFEERFKL